MNTKNAAPTASATGTSTMDATNSAAALGSCATGESHRLISTNSG